LDRIITIEDSGNYVTVVKPDGTSETVGVEGPSSETTTLTLATPLSFDPSDPSYKPHDFRFQFSSSSSTPGRKVKIDSIRPISDSVVELTAVDESTSYYDAADGIFYESSPPLFNTGPIISNLKITENGVRAGTGYTVRADIDWDISRDVSFVDIKVYVNGLISQTFEGTRRTHAEVIVSDGVTVTAEITAYGLYGRTGVTAKQSISKIIDFAGLRSPTNVTGFKLDKDTFRWNEVPDVDVVGYIIRFHYGANFNFSDANKLHDGLLPYSPKQFNKLPSGFCTFFITAVDAAGLESEIPATLYNDMGIFETANIVEQVDFRTLLWPGSLTGGIISGGDIVANSTSNFYGDDGAPFYGDSADDFYTIDNWDSIVYESSVITFPSKWNGSDMILTYAVEGQSVSIQYKTTNDDPFYGLDADSSADLYGADTDPFYGNEISYPWIGKLTLENRDYQVIVTITDARIQGAIRQLAISVDVPDIDETLTDVAIGVGGTALPITKQYDVIKNVQLTLQQVGTGVSSRILNLDVTGPVVEVIDETKTSVTGVLNAYIKGR
jgi:hypothetical protein